MTFISFMNQCNYPSLWSKIIIVFSDILKWVEKKFRGGKENAMQNTTKTLNTFLSKNQYRKLLWVLNIENDGKMRTEAVENTNSLRENTEIEIFKRISQTWVIANLRVAQKYHRLESHLKPLTRTNFGQCSFTNDKTI